jgi:hypothetical protein
MHITTYLLGMRVAEKETSSAMFRRVGRDIEVIETCGPHPFTAMGRPDERM